MKQNERKKQEKTETWLNVLDAQRMLLGFGTFRNSSSSRIMQRHVFGCMFVRWRERHVCVCKCVLDVFVLWLHYFSIPKKLSTFSTANQANQVSEPFFFRPVHHQNRHLTRIRMSIVRRRRLACAQKKNDFSWGFG